MPSGLDSLSDLIPQALALWADSNTRLMLVLLAGAGILFAWRPGNRTAHASVRGEQRPQIKRAKNSPLLALDYDFWHPWRSELRGRLVWKVRPPHDLMCVDGLTIDRTGKRSHALWPGPTGAGKSESVATVRCDGARPWLAVMPDVSDPLRRKADFIWTAGESKVPVEFLDGTPEEVAEFLTTVFRSGGNGVWMMAAREATTQVVRDIDASGKARSLMLIGDLLEELIENDRRLRTACEGWVTRFRATAMAMGDSVAAGGVDIGELLREGKGVVIDNDRWKHPGLCGDTVAFGLALAKRKADVVPGGFRLIFEEADQLGERIDLADPFFAAGRRRKIAVDALVHAEEDADDAMATNSATRVYFRPNKPEQRKAVAKSLDLSEHEVDETRDYHAWIEHDGKVRRLVHFPKPSTAVSRRDTHSKASQDTDRGHKRRVALKQLSGRPELPALPAPQGIHAILAAGIYRDGECERWRGDHNDRGYGRVRLPDGRREYVHRLRWELAYGPIPLAPNGMRMTIDHRRTCAKDCSRLEHLEMVTRGENSRRRWRVQGK